MDLAYCTEQLSANAAALQALTSGISADQARWKPGPEAWSVLEVVNHLADEEREDFRAFLVAILGGRAKTPHDPGGWIATRGYNQRGLAASVADFMHERQKSLVWLASLSDVDWTIQYIDWEGFTAGDVLASWVAHDILHQRQLVELKYAITKAALASFDLQYAGDW